MNHKRTQAGKWIVPAGFLLLLNTSVAGGQAISRPDLLSPVREKIIRLVEEKKAPSLSLAVLRNGEIIWEEAFGLANLEKSIKATPGTLYPIASASKPITATGLMILVERGGVDLDKPANAYLGTAGLRAFEGDASEATLRRILHHTSGLPMYWRFYYADAFRRRPPLETILRRYGLLVSRPGQSYNYSNLGYAVLESVIERVSGVSYPEFLTAEIFRPLGMGRATIFTSPPERPDVAEKYTSTLARVPFCDHDTRGAGAIYSTAHDLALFMLLHLGRLQPGQKAILKPDSVAEMQRSRDADVRSSSYALGWETGRRFGYPIVTHGGVMDGCRAHLAMIPSAGLAVTVLINGENVRSIQVCDWIFAALLPDYARNLEAAPAGGVSPPPAPSFRPTSEIVGNWQGAIKTYEGEIPVLLIVESDGRVELSCLDQQGRPGERLSPLKPPTLNRGIFVIHFPQVFSLDDAPSPSHRTVLGLTVQKDSLTGEANLIASDMSYSLPSYIELKRIEQERSPRSHSPDSVRGPGGCTIVMAARNGLVLAGNNEDRNHAKTTVTFIPATETYYGRVVFGYDDGPFQGGMNDQGLFIDGNALSPTGWQPDPRKPTFRGVVIMVVLGTCATCEDAKAFFEKFNFPALERARFPVADRTGASMVVEYGQGRVQFVRSDTWYQIATNFVMSNVRHGNTPCWRYRAADKILSAAKELSPGLIRDVLEKTHQEGQSLTVYSNIYDLKEGMIRVYNLRNFEEVVLLNLAEELKKGQRRLELPSLFKSRLESLPALESILESYIKALGGKEAIEKIRTRRLAGELTHDFPGQNPPKTVLPAEVIASAPDKWRLLLKTATGVQQMGFDGEHGWRQDADRVLLDSQQARSRLAYLFHPQASIRLGDYFSQLSLYGKAVSEGRAEYAVKAAGSGGTQLTLYFDAETGLLSRVGENILVKDYRREMGVLHPVHIVIAREGGTSTYRFDDVAADVAIEDGRFAVPTLDEVFPDVFEGLADSDIVPLLKDFPSVHEDMNIPCRDGRFLHDLIVRNGYKKGLEIGSFTGYSALWMGLGFKTTGGRLVTIEYEAASGEEARKNIRRAGLEGIVDARIADAFVEIPKIAGEFDFVFIDAWKPDYVKFLRLLKERVVAGGVIVAHNVTNYARDMRDYLAAIQNDAGLETTFEELSAEGMSVSKVRGPRPAPGDSRLLSSKPRPTEPPLFMAEDMRHDFNQLRQILEAEHCCLYEYIGKKEFDGIFDRRFKLLNRPMRHEEFFKIIAPITAKIGCMHTALWMPAAFFDWGRDNLFPLQVELIENSLVVTGSYRDTLEVPVGSIVLEINGLPANKIIDELRTITSADALNPHFIDAQVERRFPMFYASVFGFPKKYTVTYALPGRKTRMTSGLRPADIGSVRKVIFANFHHPPLSVDFIEDTKTAVLRVKTFIYYDRVDYFRDFMNGTFRKIKERGIENLILDLRGNDGGDPFCAVILYSYLEKEPAPYFAEPYEKYAELAKPIPLAENNFRGQLYTLLDGRCGSTNGHFSALLKYHRLGKFVGTPSGSTYKCNAGRNTEVQLAKTSLILTLGRNTYAAAVEGMDKMKPIMPDYPVRETYQDFLDGKDVYMETAFRLIKDSNRSR